VREAMTPGRWYRYRSLVGAPLWFYAVSIRRAPRRESPRAAIGSVWGAEIWETRKIIDAALRSRAGRRGRGPLVKREVSMRFVHPGELQQWTEGRPSHAIVRAAETSGLQRCLRHEDCVRHPEIGEACLSQRRRRSPEIGRRRRRS
jgi:hypothetical protein